MTNRRLFGLLAGIALLHPRGALAASPTICTENYEKGQEEKAAGHLKAALTKLRACTHPSCPKFIRDDCLQWLGEAEAALPSVVFAIRKDGNDTSEAEVTCDGMLLSITLDGKAVSLDPGMHNFTFSIPGFAPVDRQLLIREGERNRMVEVDFRSRSVDVRASATGGGKADDPLGSRSRTYLTYGLAGAGALGIGGFFLFAALGNSQEKDLEHGCSPNCSSGQVESVKTKYLIADTALGVGLVSLGIATYLYLSRDPTRKPKPGDVSSIGFSPHVGKGGMLHVSSSF